MYRRCRRSTAPSLIPYQVLVAGSSWTRARPLRRNSSTADSLPGFASNRTSSATLTILLLLYRTKLTYARSSGGRRNDAGRVHDPRFLLKTRGNCCQPLGRHHNQPRFDHLFGTRENRDADCKHRGSHNFLLRSKKSMRYLTSAERPRFLRATVQTAGPVVGRTARARLV